MLITKLFLLNNKSLKHQNIIFSKANCYRSCKSDTVAGIYHNHVVTDHNYVSKSDTIAGIYHNHVFTDHSYVCKSYTLAGLGKNYPTAFQIQDKSDEYIFLN